MKLLSKIVFLIDYAESVGNRVITIDNISDDFNDLPRTTAFSLK